MSDIPKARELYKNDINEAVVAVQKATGIEITPEWWAQNVGDNGSTEEILNRFDEAYAKLIASKQ